MATTSLIRTPATTGSTTKATLSFWFKRGLLGGINETTQALYYAASDSSNWMRIWLFTDNRLEIRAAGGGTTQLQLNTYRVIRDSGWYHIVVAMDLAESTADDKVKVYINGVRETNWETQTNPTVSTAGWVGTSASFTPSFGDHPTEPTDHFDGLMSDICFIDGQQLTASSFGETDTDTGEWKISDIASDAFTWGTNGYMILNNGDTITDQSTNSNDFTVGAGTLTNTLDCPSNVFSTWNIQATTNYKQSSGTAQTYANGNTSIIESGGVYKSPPTTLGAFTGKYYCELKFIGTVGSSLLYSTMGGVITANDVANLGDNYNHAGETAQSVGYGAYDGKTYISNVGTAYGATLADGDILSIALDLDNSKVYFSKNGVWQNSGDPTSGATGTGAVSLPASTSSWHFIGSPTNSTISANFGNGYFGTTAITSAGTPASTPGSFEYDVPSGYQPLSTKGINA